MLVVTSLFRQSVLPLFRVFLETDTSFFSKKNVIWFCESKPSNVSNVNTFPQGGGETLYSRRYAFPSVR